MPIRVFGLTDRRVVLSALWIFVVLNYLYADIVILIFRPGAYQAAVAHMSAGVAVGATLLMEFLLSMALLSRVLEYSLNRWANIIAGIVGTAFVAVTLSAQAPSVYLVLSAVEMASTLFIVWYASTWRSAAPP